MKEASLLTKLVKTLDLETNVKPATAEEVRAALCYYPAEKETIWTFILRSICISLEVFLHKQMGERYFTVGKAICGGFFIYLCAVFAHWQLDIAPVFSLTKIGFVGLVVKHFAPPDDWYKFTWLWKDISRDEYQGLVFLAFFGIYHTVANLRLLLILRSNLLGRRTHNRSSGEPYSIWDNIYVTGEWH